MTVKFTNNASTTVASGINTSATSLTVTSASAFPSLSGADDYCYLTIQQATGTVREVVKATALSTNTFTITRAQDGTTAGTWSAGDIVELRMTAALLTDVIDAATVEGVKTNFQYTPTAGQTVFSGADNSSNTMIINQSGLVNVYMNGVRLVQGTDYTVSAANNTITLTTGATTADIIDIEVYGNFTGQSGAAVAITGGSITGTAITATTLGASGTATLNTFVSNNATISGGTINNVAIGGTTQAAGNFTDITGSTATLTTAGNSTQLTLKSTDPDAAVGPRLDLMRDSASPADGDVIGQIRFQADNDAGEQTTFTSLRNVLEDASDGAEQGSFEILTRVAGTNRGRMFLKPAETVFNDDSQDLDFRVESDANTHMLFVDASDNRVFVGGSTNVNTSALQVTGQAAQSAIVTKVVNNAYSIFQGFDASGNLLTQITGANVLTHNGAANFNESGADNDFRVESTGNAGMLFVDASTNRVGIGTVSPTELVHIHRPSGTGAYIRIQDDTGGNYIGTDAGVLQFLNGSAAETMRIESSGNVGIGRTPRVALDVAGEVAIQYDTTYGLRFYNQPQNNWAFIGNDVTSSAADLRFGDSTGEVMRLTGGKVGIGTSQPQAAKFSGTAVGVLEVAGTKPVINVHETDVTNAECFMGMSGGTALLGTTGSGVLAFHTGTSSTSERMRLTNANLLIGTTLTPTSLNSTSTEEGVGIGGDGLVVISNSGQSPLALNRLTSDGKVLNIRKGGSEVGTVGTKDGDLTIGTFDTGISFINGSDAILPHNTAANVSRDAGIDLGSSTTRFRDLRLSRVMYSNTARINTTTTNSGAVVNIRAANNGIQVVFQNSSGNTIGYIGNVSNNSTIYSTSSDERLKTNIADSVDAGSKIDAIQVRQFDWKIDGAHQDYGMVAQELKDVAPEAVFEPEDADDMMAVDYSKLVPMLVKELQSLRARVAQLESN